MENPLDAFVRFAEAARLRFPAKAVAVTGSIGKTSTKEMIHAALQASALALKTRDTNNSSIESAYLISQLNQDHRFFVVEMGLRRPNQCFVRNSAMVKPDVCILTNIGNSHIENFRDKAHILEEKYLITAGMAEDGLLLVNGDDPLLWQLQCPFEKQTFAIENKNADYVAENVVLENERTTFTAVFAGGSMDVALNVSGRHNVLNALAAIAVCKRYGIEEDLILEGLASFTTQGHRQNVIRQEGVGTLISDCVNATPESMQVAFDWLQDMKCEPGGRKWAVLGHMMRLGRHSGCAFLYKDRYDSVFEGKPAVCGCDAV